MLRVSAGDGQFVLILAQESKDRVPDSAANPATGSFSICSVVRDCLHTSSAEQLPPIGPLRQDSSLEVVQSPASCECFLICSLALRPHPLREKVVASIHYW